MSFIQSCVQPAYVANRLQAPMFSKVNQGMGSVSLGFNGGLEAQAAYSPLPHIGLTGAYLSAGDGSSDSNFYKQHLWEVGIGGYDTLSTLWRYGVYAGYSEGWSSSVYSSGGLFFSPITKHEVEARFTRYSITGSFGLVFSGGTEYVLVLRYSDIHMHAYRDFQSELYFDEGPIRRDTANGPFRHQFFEPGFIMRGGSQNLKVDFHLSFIMPTVHPPYVVEGNASVGLVGCFDASKWFE